MMDANETVLKAPKMVIKAQEVEIVLMLEKLDGGGWSSEFTIGVAAIMIALSYALLKNGSLKWQPIPTVQLIT